MGNSTHTAAQAVRAGLYRPAAPRTLGHAPRPATQAEAASFTTTEGYQVLGVTGLAAHPQKTMYEMAAFQVILELPSHIRRQLPAPLRQMASERRVVFFDDPIEQGLLGPVALVTTSILVPGGRPGRQFLRERFPFGFSYDKPRSRWLLDSVVSRLLQTGEQ